MKMFAIVTGSLSPMHKTMVRIMEGLEFPQRKPKEKVVEVGGIFVFPPPIQTQHDFNKTIRQESRRSERVFFPTDLK